MLTRESTLIPVLRIEQNRFLLAIELTILQTEKDFASVNLNLS